MSKEKIIDEWFKNLDWIAKRFRFQGWGIEPQFRGASSYVRNINWEDPEGNENADLCLFEELDTIKYEKEFLERFARAKYITPPYIIKRLYTEYSNDWEHWNLPGMEEFLDRLMWEYSNVRRLADYQCYEEPEYEFFTESGRSRDFWEYYFSVAYGNRYTIYEEEEEIKLVSGYLSFVCMPSMDWRQAFIHSLHSSQTEQNANEQSGRESFVIEDKKIEIEYQMDQIVYYVNGEKVTEPVFTFEQLMTYTGETGKEELFFLFLAITSIEKEQKEYAYRVIREKIDKLPIYKMIHDFLAKALSRDNRACVPMIEEQHYEPAKERKVIETFEVDGMQKGAKADKIMKLLKMRLKMRQEEEEEISLEKLLPAMEKYHLRMLEADGKKQEAKEVKKEKYLYHIIETMDANKKKDILALQNNEVVVKFGTIEKERFYKRLETGVFGEKQSAIQAMDLRELRIPEDSYPVGWICLKDISLPYLIAVNQNGNFVSFPWDYFFGTGLVVEAKSVSGLLVKLLEFADVTKVQLCEMKEQSPVFQAKFSEEQERKVETDKKRKIEKDVLEAMFKKAIEETVAEFQKEYAYERLYALSFRIHYDTYLPEDRYQCEVIIQPYDMCMAADETGECEEAQLEYKAYKYIPEEYSYSEKGNGTFQQIRDYLFQNCVSIEACIEMEDEEEQAEIELVIGKENLAIESIMAEAVAKLRKKGVLKNQDGTDIFVFPYVGEDDLEENYIPIAKMMNQGLDLTEYLAFWEWENTKYTLRSQEEEVVVSDEEEILEFLQRVCEEEREFVVLSAQKLVENIPFIQADWRNGSLHVEVAVQKFGKNTLYGKDMSMEEGTKLFLDFFHGKWSGNLQEFSIEDEWRAFENQFSDRKMELLVLVESDVCGVMKVGETLQPSVSFIASVNPKTGKLSETKGSLHWILKDTKKRKGWKYDLKGMTIYHVRVQKCFVNPEDENKTSEFNNRYFLKEIIESDVSNEALEQIRDAYQKL